MKNIIFIIVLLFITMPSISLAAVGDDPLLTKVMSEFFYLKDNGDDVLEWNVDTWIGHDLSKLWIKSSGELVDLQGDDSDVENANIELVYSRSISPFWDQQFGVRHDFKDQGDDDSRDWLSYGFIGTAPYFIAVDAQVFVGEESSTQLLVELEKEIMLTQRWVLTPEMDLVVNGSSNEKYGEGSGLSIVEFGLRLGYERSRKFQPFIGVVARQSFGRTKDIERENGRDGSNVEAMLGIHAWF